jgi:hypothetical protein
MSKKFAILKALAAGDAKIIPIDKLFIRRTPGDTTVVGHN